MTNRVQDFPQARTCPVDTLRRLRAFDPNADVLYLGPSPLGGMWALGTMEPSEPMRIRACKALASLLRIPRHKRNHRWAQRYWMAQAQRQGFRTRSVFHAPEPDGALVNRVAFAQWDHHHTSDSEFFQQMDNADAEERARLEADLTDSARAREAWRYTFTRSHAVGISPTAEPRRSSVRTRHIPQAH